MSAATAGRRCWSWTTIPDPGHAAPHLQKAGCTVAEAANGSEAIEALERAKPALILLDLMMPGMDGFEVLRLHGDETWREVPVIIVTAKDLTREMSIG